MKNTLIVIPTYNEKENIVNLVGEIRRQKVEADILVVDDNSPDGTGRIVDDLRKKDKGLFILHRKEKNGLGRAYVAGFNWGLKEGYKKLISMDADFSHPVEALPRLIKACSSKTVAIGSRYVKGGKIEGWAWNRYVNSSGANFVTRLLLGIHAKDATAGFKCYPAEFLSQADLDNIKSGGYAFQPEMLLIAQDKGFKLVETPITFVDRRAGESKIQGELVRSAKIVFRLAVSRKGLRQFVKFGVVGLSGTLVDLGFYNLLAIVFGANIYVARTISFTLAATSNYILNRKWTFRSTDKKVAAEYSKFLFISVIGLLMNLGIMKLLEPMASRFGTELLQKNIPVLIAIIIVLLWNFFANKFWTFRGK